MNIESKSLRRELDEVIAQHTIRAATRDSSRIVGHPEVTAAKTQEPLESSAIVEAVAIVARLIFCGSP